MSADQDASTTDAQQAEEPAPEGAEPSEASECAADAPVTVLRTERHYGASDAFGYHLEIPGGFIEIEYLSDGSVRSADGAHPLDPAVFVRPTPADEG